MTVHALSLPIYEIVCPSCSEAFFESLQMVVTETFNRCPKCHEKIHANSFYSRPKVEELMKQVGYSEKFISVNDKF